MVNVQNLVRQRGKLISKVNTLDRQICQHRLKLLDLRNAAMYMGTTNYGKVNKSYRVTESKLNKLIYEHTQLSAELARLNYALGQHI